MKVAILGTWHVHAPQYTEIAQKYGEVVGVYEENAAWRADFAKRYNIKEFTSVEELLASECEGVIVCAATNKHTELIVAAAEAGKYIFAEKVLALTVEDCLKIKNAVEKNGVRFVISFPWKSVPAFMALKKAADDGLVGKVNYVRFRNCHSGSVNHWLPAHFYNAEECGGGAMIDLGAHGMYLTHWVLGEPVTYSSTFTHFCRDEKDAVLNPSCLEDNAITVMSFESGAIAVNETGFVSQGCPETFEIGGDMGYLSCTRAGATYTAAGKAPVSLELPEPSINPLVGFMTGEAVEGCGMDEAIALTKMMVGAYGNVK
ncbi:MAG: Gfo/Idh/MocA family oxidoreductase [Clostridia bacterium]|nr:Gfo/Idh/MocA family oxidoreductase [Clostridia bacterium]